MKSKQIILLILLLFITASAINAQSKSSIPLPKVGIDIGTSDSPEDVSQTLQLLLLLTILSLAPSILIMTTSYLRLIIVLNFLKQAMGTMQMPPNQLLAGIALFVTFFIMAPTFTEIHDTALKPYLDEQITIDTAMTRAEKPIRSFMLKNVRSEELELFIGFTKMEMPNSKDDLPTYVLVPAFVLSELRAGFIIGFFIFLPFLMIDMIVASILMSMGMMMLPPVLISLPFKILLFVLIDGWDLIVGSLVRSFN